MTQNLPVKIKELLNSLGYYLMWGILAALGALAAFQLQVTLLYLGILVVQSPTLRPPGWNSSTISGINRCSYVLLGILWLGLAIYLGNYLSNGLDEKKLLAYSLRMGLILGGVYLFCVVLLYLLG